MGAGLTQTRVLGRILREAAEAHPDAAFVQCGGPWVTYGEIEERSNRLAAGLQSLGVAKGDRIAFMLPNRIEFIPAMFAVAKLGLIQVPINTYLRGEFLRHQLGESQASGVIADALGIQQIAPLLGELPDLKWIVSVDGDGGAELPVEALSYAELEASSATPKLPDVTENDIANILYTSGTTGPSKGCIIDHGYYTWVPHAFHAAGWFGPGDRLFGANPLFHASGQIWLVTFALMAGGSAVVEPAFSATTFMARARETESTVLFGMGAMGLAVMAQPVADGERDHKIRQATFMPMTADLQQQFTERFGVPVVSEIYGQSECWPAMMCTVGGPRKPGSAGQACPHLEIRLVDGEDNEVPHGQPGEIVIRPKGPHMMFRGYWNNPEATVDIFRNLWHHTGDMARLDDDGFYHFVDRKKDSMRRRGENVSSLELEAAILKHPDVAAVAVHAVPSDLSEDDIKACIVPKPGAELDPKEIFGFFKAQLPYYAVPRYVELLDALPANVNGRVQKFLLRERGITDSTWDFEALGLRIERDQRRT